MEQVEQVERMIRFPGKAIALAVTLALAVSALARPASAEANTAPSASGSIAATASAEATTVKADGALIETGEGLTIDWTRGILTLTGLGFAPDRGTLTQRQALARQTAMTDGSRRLYEAVNQLRVNGNAFVRDLTAVDQTLRDALRARLAAIPTKTVTPWPDGSIEVTLELPLWGSNSLADLVSLAVDLSSTKPEALASEPSAVVLDGRGTGAQPALAIAIKDEAGNPLYAGPVTYYHSLETLGEVAGQKPLHLKARRAVGATRADFTLTAEEAKRFREAREKQPRIPVVILL